MLLLISFLSISSLKSYNKPTLIGKWKSLETGEEVFFTENGEVTFTNTSKSGRYTILSSSKMEYTIDNKTFIMYYVLDGRNLSWGLDEEKLEIFIKSPFFSL
jgi:hypothetical protein